MAFAPANIALCKYWGKRDTTLNLPLTSSLSISLGKKGATCTVQLSDQLQDICILNGKTLAVDSKFSTRITQFLDLFRPCEKMFFHVNSQMNIPLAAGLASSACGFASLVLALNDFFGWKLSQQELSILARLGSGSACRSLVQGFVEWQAGLRADGMDSLLSL